MRLFELGNERPSLDKEFPRNIMPQIRIEHLKDSPFQTEHVKELTANLKPVQTQRVKGMVDKAKRGFADGTIRPIIVDRDNYIVNGHHRYDVARGTELDRVNVIRVDATIEELIKHFSNTASQEPTMKEQLQAKLDLEMEGKSPHKKGTKKYKKHMAAMHAESQGKDKPKQNNPVAKHSRNMAGAGAHKSPKDYDRKNKKKDISSQLDEGPYIASRSDIVHSVMRELEAKAHVDDNFLHHLAELVGKKLTQRNQDNHRGRWVSQKK